MLLSGSGPGLPPALAATEFLCILRMHWRSKKRVRYSRVVLDAAGHGALLDIQGIVLWADAGNGRLSSSRRRADSSATVAHTSTRKASSAAREL